MRGFLENKISVYLVLVLVFLRRKCRFTHYTVFKVSLFKVKFSKKSANLKASNLKAKSSKLEFSYYFSVAIFQYCIKRFRKVGLNLLEKQLSYNSDPIYFVKTTTLFKALIESYKHAGLTVWIFVSS